MSLLSCAVATFVVLLSAGGLYADSGAVTSVDAEKLQSRQTAVREAERSFARTMAERDLAAFAEHVAEDAVFLGSQRTLRGRAEIRQGWAAFFEAPSAPFSWEPERVELLVTGGLALSSGPVKDPQGKLIGRFVSTWRLEADGRWRIVLDIGCPACDCP